MKNGCSKLCLMWCVINKAWGVRVSDCASMCTCMHIRTSDRVYVVVCAHLDCRSVDIKLLEDGEGLLKELITDADVGNVWSIVVVQTVDILHHTSLVSFHRCQD